MRALSTLADVIIWFCIIAAPLILLRAAGRKLSARKARRARGRRHGPAVRFHVPEVTDEQLAAFLDEAIRAHGEDGCHE